MASAEAVAELVVVPARKRLGLLGRKLGMTQLLTPEGAAIAVTVIEAGPCVVLQKKTVGRDGYDAIQLGYEPSRASRETKARIGHADAAGKGTFRHLQEFQGAGEIELGATLSIADLFHDGDLVNVTGTTKGRGFAGVFKRHGFHGVRATHGTHEFFRHGGSIGNASYPGRVFPGKKMPGHYGTDTNTTRNLRIQQIRLDDNVLVVRGAIAGANGGLVVIRPSLPLEVLS
ncbi:MAG: 50S ribosomal protein L3 [Deltaproteobacteria bacterium]